MKIDESLMFNKNDAIDPKKFNEILAWLGPIRQEEQDKAKFIYKEIINEINETGVNLKSIDEILIPTRTLSDYLKMLPIIIKSFKQENNSEVKEGLARQLTVKWANPDALHPLAEEFGKFPDNWIWHGAKWAIGNALDVIADDSILEKLINIVANKKNGSAREMVVSALGNMKQEKNKKRAIEELIKLLDDEEVVGYALISLRKLKAVETEKIIREYINYPQTWVKNEAKKTIKSFEKLHYAKIN